jgi:potassium/sodium efflux P-type ATPase
MTSSPAPIWALPVEAAYQSLGSNENGLSGDEASQRLQQFGANELPEPAQRPLWLRFSDQLTHFMALLLWVAGILAFISRTPELGWAIWAVIWINAIFSFWQEFQAEQALAALKKVLPMQVKVKRDGHLQQILARELVRGDVMELEEGDRISADARLVSAESLSIDVSVMTGESLPVARSAYPVRLREAVPIRGGKTILRPGEQPLQERVNPSEIANLVLAGSTVAAGRAVAVVYATGAQTEFGQIAHLTTVVKRAPSTLEIQIARIVRIITTIAIGMGLTVFLLSYFLIGLNITESFIFAIGIIVANVPEGLLPTVTLALALGVKRMARKNALVRRLSAVENLSATTVICTDKTGTLTKNEMTVRYLWLPPHPPPALAIDHLPIEITGAGYDPTSGKIHLPTNSVVIEQVNLLLLGSALCSNAKLIHLDAPSRWQEIGDPTEAALLVAAAKAGLNLAQRQQQLPRLREIPFDSRRRMMTVVLNWQAAELWSNDLPYLAFTKGAPLEVLKHCQAMLQDSKVQELTPDLWQQIVQANDDLARQGFRVLGLAARKGGQELLDLKAQDLEQDLIFIGLVAMFDPPRPEVPEAIERCHTAGIKVTMVTGDYGLTAEAIARHIGLVVGDQVRVMTGESMGQLSDAQLQQNLKYRGGLVFARMSPEHKLRLVQAYRDIGEVVAVTGDGVNDAPALRAANIGIAMGLNGTDVAREAADIVLTDDNFATIVVAIEQGRSIYQNIRKFMTYILASNVPEIVPFLGMVAFKIPPALTILQILAVDLGTDMVPALALGAESPEPGLMKRPPRPRNESLLNGALLRRAYGFLGAIEAVLSMLGFFLVWSGHGYSLADLQQVTPAILAHTAEPTVTAIYRQSTTMTLAIIVACQVGNLFACRSDVRSAFRQSWANNSLLWFGICFECVALFAFIDFPPFRSVFATASLESRHWLLVLLCPPLLLGAEELRKIWLRKQQRSSKR